MKLSGKVIDISGQQFGRWTAIDYIGDKMWSCQCVCGTISKVDGRSLRSGISTSCGCYAREKISQRHEETRNSRIGQKVGRLYVESVNDVNQNMTTFNCVCECGNRIVVSNSNLFSGHTTSCGCYTRDITNARNKAFRDDLVGQRFGRLVVKNFVNCIEKISRYTCLCDCGIELDIIGTNLTTGNTTSCGCYARELACDRMKTHGLSHHRLYGIWNGMIQRCTNEQVKAYQHYGNKGISVHEEWRHDFKSFYDWAVTNGYEDNLSIERQNNDLNYTPNNCTWIAQSEQARNKSTTKLSMEDAEKIRADNRLQKEIAKDYGVRQPTISAIKLNKIWKI